MAGGSPPPETPRQTTTHVLGPEQRRIFELAFPGVEAFAANTPPRYQGSTIAPFNAQQVAGQEGVLSAAPTQANVVQGGANASQFWTQPDVWDPANNAMLSSSVDAAVRPITQAYTQDFLPALRSESIKMGGLGGSRQGVHEAIGMEKTSRAIGDAAAKVVGNAYDTNVRAQLQALGLVPQTAMAQNIPGTTTSSVGDVRQAQEQAMLNETVGNFNYDQLAPYLQAKELMSLISGMPGGSVVSTANNPPQPSQMMSALGGAASGATLGSMLLPGIGTAGGAAIGGLLPFLLG